MPKYPLGKEVMRRKFYRFGRSYEVEFRRYVGIPSLITNHSKEEPVFTDLIQSLTESLVGIALALVAFAFILTIVVQLFRYVWNTLQGNEFKLNLSGAFWQFAGLTIGLEFALGLFAFFTETGLGQMLGQWAGESIRQWLIEHGGGNNYIG